MRRWILHITGRASNARARALELAHSDRGDVPGWVMVTLLSAALAMALIVVAEPALVGMLERGLKSVVP